MPSTSSASNEICPDKKAVSFTADGFNYLFFSTFLPRFARLIDEVSKFFFVCNVVCCCTLQTLTFQNTRNFLFIKKKVVSLQSKVKHKTTMITQRTKNNIAKFVADYNKTVAEVYGQESKDNALAEDCTTFYMLDITILKTKIKVATTYTGYGEKTYHDDITDEDDAREYLAKWRADMRRARRYWAMDVETIDKMQDGEIEDIEEE